MINGTKEGAAQGVKKQRKERLASVSLTTLVTRDAFLLSLNRKLGGLSPHESA